MSVASERPAPTPGAEAPETGRRPSIARSFLREARPKQWVKNVLVFAAPGAAGVLTEPDQLGRTLIAFVAFCLAASGTYFLNDAMDAEADRQHPTKRNRPIAAGLITTAQAKVTAVVLIVLALAHLGAAEQRPPARGGRRATSSSPSRTRSGSSTSPSSTSAASRPGFGLRAIAGGYATDVPLSNFFLIVVGAGSLFIVAGKRHAELAELGESSAGHRQTLGEYSDSFLNYVRAVTSGVAITGYASGRSSAPPRSATRSGSASRSSRSCSPSSGTRSPSNRAAAARPRRSCCATACSSCSAWSGWRPSPSESMPAEPGTPEPRRLLTGWGRTAPTAAGVVVAGDGRRRRRRPRAPGPARRDRPGARAQLRRRGAERGRVGDRRHLARPGARPRPRPGRDPRRGGREPRRAAAPARAPRLVRARDARHPLRHRRRGARGRHPRQEPPRGRQLRQPRGAHHAAHAEGRARGRARRRPRAVLDHGRRDGPHRHRHRGDVPAAPDRDRVRHASTPSARPTSTTPWRGSGAATTRTGTRWRGSTAWPAAPSLGRSVLLRGDHAPLDQLPPKRRRTAPPVRARTRARGAGVGAERSA